MGAGMAAAAAVALLLPLEDLELASNIVDKGTPAANWAVMVAVFEATSLRASPPARAYAPRPTKAHWPKAEDRGPLASTCDADMAARPYGWSQLLLPFPLGSMAPSQVKSSLHRTPKKTGKKKRTRYESTALPNSNSQECVPQGEPSSRLVSNHNRLPEDPCWCGAVDIQPDA